MTGWGQTGPLAHTAGHDIDYIGYGGVLSMSGPPGGAPVPPGVQVATVGIDNAKNAAHLAIRILRR